MVIDMFDSLNNYMKYVNEIFDSLGIQNLRMYVSEYNSDHICLKTLPDEYLWYWHSVDEFLGNNYNNRSFFEVCKLMYTTYLSLAVHGDKDLLSSSYVWVLNDLNIRFLRVASKCSSFEELKLRLAILGY